MRRPWVLVRAVGRAMGLGVLIAGAAISWWFTGPKDPPFPWRAAWLHRLCSRLAGRLKLTIHVSGEPARTGIVASNHLGYLDILVLAAISPQVFLAKSEVRDWPLIGRFAARAGTQFIDRQRRSDVARQNAELKRIVENDAVQTIFLEGTSSGGASVLPFKSSLLEPVVENQWRVTPAAIFYECEGGEPSRDVCWWGDMKFTPHALRLLTLDQIVAHVAFGRQMESGGDRKALAALLHREVAALKQGIERTLQDSAAPR